MAETYWQKLAEKLSDGHHSACNVNGLNGCHAQCEVAFMARILEEELSGIITAARELTAIPCHSYGGPPRCTKCQAEIALRSALAERGLR